MLLCSQHEVAPALKPVAVNKTNVSLKGRRIICSVFLHWLNSSVDEDRTISE